MSEGYRPAMRVDTEAHLRAALDRQGRRQRDLEEGDIVIEEPRRLLLRSPNGTYFTLSVDDAGALTATDVGTKL